MNDFKNNHQGSLRVQKKRSDKQVYNKHRKNKIILGITCAVFTMNNAFALFENGGFEQGNFDGWEKVKGMNYGLRGNQPFNHENIVISAGGVEIIKVTDEVFDNRAPHLQLPYNGNFSAKINDEHGGYHLNAIQQKDIITEEDRDPVDGKLHVRFAYAAVLDDPGHVPSNQPYFHVQLKDLSTGEMLYEDMAFSNQPGRLFYTTQFNGTWRATPFIEVDIVVPDSSLGHELEIRTLAADCSQSGHGGYVYVDSFGSKAIRPNQACLNDVKVRSKPNNVQITWGDSGASGYRVYRANRFDGPFSLIGETDSKYSTFLDKDVVKGNEYFYSVRPLDAEGREVCGSGSVVSIVPEHIEPGKDINRSPIFVTEPLIHGTITAPYQYLVDADDMDGDPLLFKLLTSPTGMSIDAQTGAIDWKPEAIGIYEVSIQVADDKGGKAIQSYSIAVIDNNLPPEILNKIPERIPAGVNFRHQVQAKDPENQRLSYSIASQAADMRIDQNGWISLNNPRPGRYPVTVVVSDPHGAKAIEQLVLVVMGAPQFTSVPVVNGSVNAPYQYKAEAFDADGDVLTYHLAQAPNGMTINAQNGDIHWLPNAESTEQIIIEAKDPDGNTVKQSYTLKITLTDNRAPVITSQPLTYIPVDQAYIYQVTGQDPDGDSLVWRLVSAPKGMEIEANNGKITWGKSVAGAYDVVIQVEDRRGGVATQDYKLRVGAESNTPPSITSIPVTAWDVGVPYEYQMVAVDADNDPLVFKLEKGPAGAQLSANGKLTWANPTLGLHEIQVSVSDGFAKLTQTFSLAVNEDQKNNLPPSITSIPKTSWEKNKPYEYRIIAKDPEGSQLTYQLKTGPAGAVLDQNGYLKWANPLLGQHPIAVVVSDGYNLVEQGYTLYVHEAAIENQAPQITSEPFGLAQTGKQYEYQLIATDSDGDALTYTMVEGPNGSSLSSDGQFVWDTPIKGSHAIQLKVSDGYFDVVQSFTLTVQDNAVDNLPPEISTTPKTRWEVGQPYEYQMVATDPEGDPLTYQLVKGPTGASFSANGLLSWATPIAGTHEIVLSVGDGAYTVQQSYQLIVHEKVVENQSPQILSEPFTLASVGQPYEYQMVASDPEGDLLIYLLEDGPNGATFDSSGRFIWKNPTLGSHTIKLRVSDGQLYVTQNFVLKVQKEAVANLPPAITSKPNIQGWLGEAYQYQMAAVDPEGDALTYKLAKGPVGATMDGNGLLVWTTPVLGVHMFELQVSDGDYTVTQTFGLAINDKNGGNHGNNKAPVITSKPHGYGEETVAYQYQVIAYDPDGDAIRYALLQGPQGMAVDAQTGLLTWPNPVKGIYTVEVRADDGKAYQTQGYKLNISEKNGTGTDDSDAGVFKGTLSVHPAVVKPNEDIQVVLELKGGDKPYKDSTLMINGVNVPSTNDSATVKYSDIGRYVVVGTAKDSNGQLITLESSFIVKDVADITPPTADITAPVSSDNINIAEITTSVDIVGTAFDDNFAEYTLFISPAGEKSWIPIKTSTTPVVKGKLGEINPQTMTNGQYDLLLLVKDNGGNQSSASIGLVLKGEQKIGQFALSFEDLSFEAGSLPLFLTRTYDTLLQNNRLDFGFGWSATYQDVKIQTNRTPGLDWEIVKVGAGLNAKFCPRPIGQRLVTVRMPGGTMERFKVKTSPECNTWQSQMAGSFFSIDFEPMSGTTSELVATDVGDLRVHNDQLIDYDTVDVVNPNEFRLTTKNGDVYYLDKSFGIRQIKDKTGNTLSFTKNGIFHSGGANILFNRDAQGRIVKAETTDGRSLSYAYDGDGNLKSVTDPKGEKTQFTYLQNMKAPHQLDEIIGADGKRLFKAEFDDKGQLISQTDGNGFKVNLEHNRDKNEDVVIDQQGNRTVYLYDDQGNVNKVTDALGNTTTYTYDEFGNETSITDALGHTTKYEHNKWGEVTKETNALGFSTTTAYNANNEPTEFVDELGRKTVNLYKHDTMQLEGIQDAMGNTTKIGYSHSGNLGAITDPMGNSTSFGYQKINGKELKTSETDAAGNVTRFKYDQYGNEIERSYDVVQNGVKKTLTTKQSFDVKGNLLSSTDEVGNTQRYEYNSLDQMVKQTDAKGRTTMYEYDGNGNQVKVTDPWGRVAETVYDAKGQVTKVCDEGVCNETQFDVLGRETKSINALGFANESVYDGNGQLTESIDALGHTTKYEYDALGRQTKVVNALNITASTSQYDAVGNLVQQTDANGNKVTNVYDDNNRLIEQKNALNQVTKHDYDKAGRKVATESPNGAKKQFKYNSISQLYQVLDGLNQSTLYTYDSQGKLLTQTDANKQTTRFAYNDLGQRVSRTLPEGQVESSSYNTQGDLLSTKNFKGETTSFKYNGKEQLESITYPDKRLITHSYNAKGDLVVMKDSLSGELTYQRDDLGQTLKVTTPTGELGYTWNGNGQKLSQSINQLGSYQYSYDALGRIVAVEAIDGSLTQFGYDDVGNRTHIKRANGSESFYSYNVINQLTKLEHKQGNQTLASFEYTLDNMGRKVEAKEVIDGATRTLNYEYDIEGRLLAEKITEAGKTSETRYAHDAQGNRLTKLENGEKTAYSYNKNDQLLAETINKNDGSKVTITYGWDLNGNLISKKSDDNSVNVQYGWNSANRLIKVTDGAKTTTYQYDGEDRRIGKVITDGTNTTETQYLIDSERNYDEIIVAKTRTNGGNWKEELYLYAPDGVGDLLLQSEAGTEHLYQDGKGSTRLVVNNNGMKTTFDYDAFGNPLASNANPESHIKHRYVGEVLDEETGFYYFRARHYDPKIGRFISRDSFEGMKTTPISLNPYLYAHSDPMNMSDPTGYYVLADVSAGEMIYAALQTIGSNILRKVMVKKIIVPLILSAAVGGTIKWNDYLKNKEDKKIARDALEAAIISNALTRFKNDAKILYHYTSEDAARSIWQSQTMKCGAGYKGQMSSGQRFPEGAYATDIEPWDPLTTQRMLKVLFFGGAQHPNLTWFVAIDGTYFANVYGTKQYYMSCLPGDYISVDAFVFGPSLLDP